jgi:hypothetical protein
MINNHGDPAHGPDLRSGGDRAHGRGKPPVTGKNGRCSVNASSMVVKQRWFHSPNARLNRGLAGSPIRSRTAGAA